MTSIVSAIASSCVTTPPRRRRPHPSLPAVALATLACAGLAAAPAHAAKISEDLHFSLSGFVDITGNAPPPNPLVTGWITVSYDPALTYDNDTTDIVVHSLTGITVDSTLGFTYQGGYLEFGGIQNDADLVFSNTNDLVVAFNVTDPAHPAFVPCSTPGYTCGKYTGSALVEAAGYTEVGSNTGWFYGAPQSTVTPSAVPEPTTAGLFGLGLLAIGWTRRRPRA